MQGVHSVVADQCHRGQWTKGKEDAATRVDLVYNASDGNLECNINRVLDTRSDKWDDRWHNKSVDAHYQFTSAIRDAIKEANVSRDASEVEVLNGTSIRDVANSFPKHTSIGLDLWTFSEIVDLSLQDFYVLGQLLPDA